MGTVTRLDDGRVRRHFTIEEAELLDRAKREAVDRRIRALVVQRPRGLRAWVRLIFGKGDVTAKNAKNAKAERI